MKGVQVHDGVNVSAVDKAETAAYHRPIGPTKFTLLS
jgi:hypothetical protein